MHRIGRKRLFLTLFLVILFIPPLLGATVNAQGQSSDWPMYCHDPARTGYSDTEGPENGSVRWRYLMGGDTESPPAVAAGRLYIGSYDGHVYCLDAFYGNLIWKYQTGQDEPDGVSSSPAVVEGKVFVATGPYVYCLLAHNGLLLWRYQTGDQVHSSPNVVDGRVYAGSLDHRVYCLDAGDGSLIWDFETEALIGSSPAVADGKVYIGSFDEYLYCLNASDGSLIWRFYTDSLMWSDPAIIGERVYVGGGSYDWGCVWCLNANTGTQIWNYTTPDRVSSSPAVAYDRVYVGSWDDYVYCLGALGGNLIWKYQTSNVVWGSPAVADGKVYVVSGNLYVQLLSENNEDSFAGSIYCLNAYNGALTWSYECGAVESSPAVVDGRVYVGSRDSHIYCFSDEFSGLSDPLSIMDFVAVGGAIGIIGVVGLAFYLLRIRKQD